MIPVLYHLSEFVQTHVHWVGDAIQPSHPPSPPSPSLTLSQHQGLFQWVSTLSGSQSIVASASASVLPVNIQGWLPLGWTSLISLKSKGLLKSLLQHHSCVSISFCFFLGQVLRNGIVGSFDKCIFSFICLPNCFPEWLYHFIFLSSMCRVAVAPYPCQHLLLLLF